MFWLNGQGANRPAISWLIMILSAAFEGSTFFPISISSEKLKCLDEILVICSTDMLIIPASEPLTEMRKPQIYSYLNFTEPMSTLKMNL